MTLFFEDIVIGAVETVGTHHFTAEEIKAFAGAYDPQPFHLDEQAAEASHFGALCASGWQTASVWMRLMIQARTRQAADRLAQGLPVARMGPSPGIRDLKWILPVYAGDTLTYTCTVTDKRESASRPQWGIVSQLGAADNQAGKRVFEFTGTAFWERRRPG